MSVETAKRPERVYFDPPSTDEQMHRVPPPVVIEEAKRVQRFEGVQTAMRRLPEIDEPPVRKAATTSPEYSDTPIRIPTVDTGTLLR